MAGIFAQKLGMTRTICQETGKVTPVTLLGLGENKVLQVKTIEKDGYNSVVLGSNTRKKSTKNIGKQYKNIQEFSFDAEVKKGDSIDFAFLADKPDISITATSKGKGFSGVIKRYNFSRGPETHGSTHHREPGSVGMCAKPGRILKGKKLPGQYGNARTTIRTEIVDIDLSANILAVKGAVPGATKSIVSISTL
jgi:large subunit ribosomal protein L3